MQQNVFGESISSTLFAVIAITVVSISLTQKYYQKISLERIPIEKLKDSTLIVMLILLVVSILFIPVIILSLKNSPLNAENTAIYIEEFIGSLIFIAAFFVAWKILMLIVKKIGDLETEELDEEVENLLQTNYPFPKITSIYTKYFTKEKL